MPKFLSARRLGIKPAEHRALVRVAEIIGASAYAPDDELISPDVNEAEATTGLSFNMGWQAKAYDCGTSCCIGGHVSLHMQGVDLSAEHICITADERDEAQAYVNQSDPSLHGYGPLSPLYYPGHNNNGCCSMSVMDAARPGDAVHAIRNFLTTGRPEWEEVIRQRVMREALS
ncbi:hypothetical protein [Methylorubrum suomiense]|uniref:Uncharacterized protein n=1 Tax=Methylorubrum suomiense TaxID=144191 RepID=A0ABQ4V0W2_9HYPH|nr:hypothetical protein [Methylorubrum suomiense]GJE78057.1 hypothetical protein BGCPKDLD_4668 [Methylorubrum suomiense]